MVIKTKRMTWCKSHHEVFNFFSQHLQFAKLLFFLLKSQFLIFFFHFWPTETYVKVAKTWAACEKCSDSFKLVIFQGVCGNFETLSDMPLINAIAFVVLTILHNLRWRKQSFVKCPTWHHLHIQFMFRNSGFV